jgi:uncharacterized protein YeaO (DUF488 family)
MALRVKRVYEAKAPGDGSRVLVDRVWPRGLSRESLSLYAWLREIGPSDHLRRWFGHEPERWPEFQRRYFEELRSKEDLCREILSRARRGTVTLLFGARDEKYNQAVALKAYLDRKLRSSSRKK